jgi:hypothetical protein
MTEPTASHRPSRAVTFIVPDDARSMPTQATIHAPTAAELIAGVHRADVTHPPEAA